MTINRTIATSDTLKIWLDAYLDSNPVYWSIASFLRSVDEFCNVQNLPDPTYTELHDYLVQNASDYNLEIVEETCEGVTVQVTRVKADVSPVADDSVRTSDDRFIKSSFALSLLWVARYFSALEISYPKSKRKAQAFKYFVRSFQCLERFFSQYPDQSLECSSQSLYDYVIYCL